MLLYKIMAPEVPRKINKKLPYDGSLVPGILQYSVIYHIKYRNRGKLTKPTTVLSASGPVSHNLEYMI